MCARALQADKYGGRCWNMDREHFYCPRRYVPTGVLGRGSYGLVCVAKDRLQKKQVAIKKIAPMAKTVTDAKHILREIRLMRYLGVHRNIVTLLDLYLRPARRAEQFRPSGSLPRGDREMAFARRRWLCLPLAPASALCWRCH